MIKNTLLIVDDESNLFYRLKQHYIKENHDIFLATSIEQGLNVLENHLVQLIIFNHKTSSKNSLEFLHQVKILYPNSIRILLSDNSACNTIKNIINESYIYKFLTKPNDALLFQSIDDGFCFYNNFQKNTNKSLTKLKKIEDKIKNLMEKDKLSGLNNRVIMIENIKYYIYDAKKNNKIFALVHIDIDHFHEINNALGRDSGDQVLRLLSNRLKKFINDASKIARIGSDDFAIILTDIMKSSDANLILKKLIQLIKEPIQINNAKYYISVSIGVSFYPKNGGECEVLMRNADLALQHSKVLGGDNYQFYKPKLHGPVKAELELASELHIAIEKKQFELYYQPAFLANTRGIVGAEALLRWHHPTLGLLTPDKFILLCESTGLIIPLGKWVINTACQQIKIWHDFGYCDFRVAVNLSARQFNDPDFLNIILQALNTSHIEPKYLIFEITESVVMQNMKLAIEILNALKKLGVTLASDDFGTGYSSLSYIQQLPFDALKIDKSFIDHIDIGHKNEAIVAAIIAMAKALNLLTIAEGVEREVQLEILKKHHCNFIQGYLLSKPITVEELTNLLQEQYSKKIQKNDLFK